MTRLLIIGGTGSLGTELVKFYSKDDQYKVSVFSRDSIRQSQLRSQYPHVQYFLGDICDYFAVKRACWAQDIVINTAAVKHVGLGETDVEEYVRVNITGAQNIVRVCKEIPTPYSLLISSDKAVSAINLYGRTKAVAEDIYTQAGYGVLRYGNVISSRGSFLHIWKDLINKNKPIKLRDPTPTRFCMTLDDAVALVDDIITAPVWQNTVYVPHTLQSFSLYGLAHHMTDNVKTEHLLPGEKQHEILLSPHEQGMIVSDLLAAVHKGYRGTLDRNQFDSQYAPMITPEEVLERVKL